MILFYETLFILAALAFALLMFAIVGRGRNRSVTAGVVSPDVARRHRPVIYLIRGAQLLILVPLLGVVALIGIGFVLSLNPFRHPPPNNIYFSVIMLTLVPLVGAVFVWKTIDRFHKAERPMFQDLWRVDETSVSTFAFIFAAFAAHDVYQLMPPWKPGPADSHLGLLVLLLHRDFLWIIVFFLGRSCVITILNRVLALNPKTPPSNPEPPDSSGDGPYVPFNPYDLSKNPPYRPAPGHL